MENEMRLTENYGVMAYLHQHDDCFSDYSGPIKAWVGMRSPHSVKIHLIFGVDVYSSCEYDARYVTTVHSFDSFLAVVGGGLDVVGGQTNCAHIPLEKTKYKRRTRQPVEFKRQLWRHKIVRSARKDREEWRQSLLSRIDAC